jgi:r-opsin
MLDGIGTSCTFDFLTRDWNTRSFILGIFMGEFVLPVLLIFGSYACVGYVVLKRRRDVLRSGGEIHAGIPENIRGRTEGVSSETRIAIMLTVLVLVFISSWTPYCCVAIIGQFGDIDSIYPLTSGISTIIAKVVTSINPIIYAIGHRRFQEKILLLKNCVRINRVHPEVNQ